MGRSLPLLVGQREPAAEAAGAMTANESAALRELDADLDTVFIDDHCCEILARFLIADGDGIALRTVLHGECLHGDEECSITG